MNILTQNNRLLKIDTVLAENDLLLDEFHGREALSEPFRFDLELFSSKEDLELKSLLGTAMTVRLLTAFKAERYFHGHVHVFQQTGSDGGISFYRAVLSPFTAFLEQRVNCRVFQEKTRREIIEVICQEYGAIAPLEFHVATDAPLTLCCQYNESDAHFIFRLAEEAGWSFSFKHEAKKHTLVFRDDTTTVPALPEGEKIAFNVETGAITHDSISAWSSTRQMVPNRVAVKTFDFKRPKEASTPKVETDHDLGKLPPLEHYQSHGPYTYKDFDEGEAFARLRMEEHEALSKHFMGKSNARHLVPGQWFELSDHWEICSGSKADREFLLLVVEHHGQNNFPHREGVEDAYTNTFQCIRKKIPFRPGRRSKKPVMQGIQTALVVGPKDEAIFCDEHGRVKVQFHWDREGKGDDKSSCWVRVATQWAGSRFGMMSVPRVGTEVLVDFLNGDPDRPIITGAVYNSENMPPWDLPTNKTQSGILTRSTKDGHYENSNALRFEDKKGEEELWIHAEKDQRIEVEHDESHEVGNDRKKTIKHDETTEVGNDRTETVIANEKITIGGNRTEIVTGNENITITGNRTESVVGSEDVTVLGHQTNTVMQYKMENVALASTEHVGLARNLTVGAAYTIEVIGGMNTMVGLAQAEEVGLAKTVVVGQKLHISAGTKIEIVCGGSSLVMNPDGTIELKGSKIKIDGGTGVQINGATVDLN